MSDDGQLLLDYVRRGDVSSLSTLVERHARWLTAYLRSAVPTEADADDVFQEVWFKVIRTCGNYRGGSVRAYLATVARSVVVDRFRRNRQQTVSLDAEGEEGSGLLETLDGGSEPPDAAFETRATSEDIRLAVRALPPGPRDVLMMRIEGGLSFREIAASMGIPLGTALTWMRTATKRLEKMLGENR